MRGKYYLDRGRRPVLVALLLWLSHLLDLELLCVLLVILKLVSRVLGGTL